MTDADVHVAGDGQALELVPRRGDREDLERLLRGGRPPVRSRRAGGRLRVPFSSAEDLVDDDDIVLRWTEDARRAVANRRRVRESAPEVLTRARELRDGGKEVATPSIIDSGFVDMLDEHQIENVALMTIAGGWGACVFDEQGTGKTLTVIAAFDILAERNEADVLVVVAPKSMVGEWSAEFERFTGDLYTVAVADGSKREKGRAISAGADVIVINYEGAVALRNDLKLLARRCRVVLAIDESYNVKNPEAIRSGAIAELRELCDRCFVLCGTPAPNSARDLVAQFDLVDFGYTFDGFSVEPGSHRERDEIRTAMEARGIYTRNLKQAVLPDLPERRYTEVGIDLAPIQQRLYAAALDQLVDDLRELTDAEYLRNIGSFLGRRNALLRICSNPAPLAAGYDELPAKLAALDEILPQYLDAGEKVIVWSFYRASLDALAGRYGNLGLVRIDGSVTDTTLRREAVRAFQEDDEVRIFLGNPAAAGAGLTLHSARLAIYESMSNQAAHFMQSLDRIHRRGQRRDVEYVFLLCQGTLEEIEYQRLLAKTTAQADVLGDPESARPTRQILLSELAAAQDLLRGA